MSTEDKIKATGLEAHFTLPANEAAHEFLLGGPHGIKIALPRIPDRSVYEGILQRLDATMAAMSISRDLTHGIVSDYLYRAVTPDLGAQKPVVLQDLLDDLSPAPPEPPRVRTVSNEEFLERARRVRKKHARLLEALGK
ncbi:hypothetical protein [Aureimonas psammosilenae]|uniref:hypothetical protein n=1 Tax=Aureimonas psammosilenae TaxID=2495496 RepID=UPI001260EB51|nr:hypothetical protein [Aureimonas psammosilenae]